MEGNPLLQVIIALIILLLMGYVAYNIYVIELHNMFKGDNNIKKEIDIIQGVYDFQSNGEWKYNTINKLHNSYLDISPSINQSGGAEYSYNFWLYVNQTELDKNPNNKKDLAIFLKGEKEFYYNKDSNFNCSGSFHAPTTEKSATLVTKSPLIRLKGDGSALIFEYNNLLTPDSFRNNFNNEKCSEILTSSLDEWEQRNKNLLGIYDIKFDKKWYMITFVLKELADPNDILTNNRALCKIYINGMLMYENKIETIYGDDKRLSATPKNVNSPFYINPKFDNIINSNYNYFMSSSDLATPNVVKIADLKYFNYAANDDIILSIYNRGLNQTKAVKKSAFIPNHNAMVTYNDIEDSKILKVP